MITKQTGITIESVGIADILQRWQLAVPLNQRPYAWELDNVEKLFQDLNNAFGSQPLYFMGTVMFTHGDGGRIEVADGQQRLATISMLLAAMRDYLVKIGDDAGASQYQSDFLIKYDPPSGNYRPRLTLNTQDNDYFYHRVLLPPDKRDHSKKGDFSSHTRISEAADAAAAFVKTITGSLSAPDTAKRLYDWIEYLKTTALVIVVNVPASVGNSFKMFETLNARGVPATQVDILKNFLFDRAPGQAPAIHANWLSMLSVVESYGDDDLVLTFLRHLWVSQYGPTTVDELGTSFEKTITNERRAVDFVSLLSSAAVDYIALLTPLQSPRWEGLTTETRKALDIISNDIAVVQIRPLMLAVTRRFDTAEIEKAFKLFLSWSVRFLIVGGGGGGKLDRYYGITARDVTDGKIKSVDELVTAMDGIIPNDKAFQEEFARANVTKTNLARYYLRAIELYRADDPAPQFLMNEDPNAVNLEHVLPINPSADWAIDPETASVVHKRLGNMVLLGTKINSDLGAQGFATKKIELAKSLLSVTNEVAHYDKWGAQQIRERQVRLAEIAPKVWPLKWK